MNQAQVSRQRSKRYHLWVLQILITYTLCRHSYRAGMSTTVVGVDEFSPSQYVDRHILESTIATINDNQMIPRAHRIDKSKLPYKCGLVFFYHLPSTGGATIKQWLSKYTQLDQSEESTINPNLFEHWGRKKDGSAVKDMQTVFINGNKHHDGMNGFVKNIKQDEWRIAHCHHSSLHLNTTEQYLSRWRDTVESQGCAFIAATMFRDPLSHTMSLHKHIKRFDSSREGWTNHLESTSNMGQWSTQLDYFLYNFIDRNPDEVDKDAKVQRALQLLRDHFDVVSVGEHDRFKKELLDITGFPDIEMKRANTFHKDLAFTKTEVEQLQKLLDSNGDIEFMYEVKKLYNKS